MNHPHAVALVALLGLLAAGCHPGSDTQQSLNVWIAASNPGAPTEPQTLEVFAELFTTTNYSDAVSGPLGSRSPASATETSERVTPDSVILELDGHELCRCGSYQWSPATVSDGAHHFTATATYRGFTGAGTLDWALDRRPATFQPLGPPRATGYASGTSFPAGAAVAVGPSGEPLLFRQVRDPISGNYTAEYAAWDGSTWEWTWFSTQGLSRPSLNVDGTGGIWAAWNGVVGWVARNTAGAGLAFELTVDGLPPTRWDPVLASEGDSVFLALLDGTVPVRHFEDGGWVPSGPPLDPPRDPFTVRVAVSGGNPVVALEEADGGSVLELMTSVDGGTWTPVAPPLFLAYNTGHAPIRHLGDVVTRSDGAPVVAWSADGPEISVAVATPSGWVPLGAPLPYFDVFATLATHDATAPPPVAIAAVPDGGVALLLPADQGAMQLWAWDGTRWTVQAGPLRGRVGVTTVLTAALTFDSTGRPLAAWQQENTYDLDTVEVWWP